MSDGILKADFYDRDVVDLAVELLGKVLVRRSRFGLTSGRIVETEAYLPEGDSAAHSAAGVNRKNATMFGPAGRAYVYTIHARQCVNVVARPRSAVLIRAVEPLRGKQLMAVRRGTEHLRDLCRGPARLCEAFGIGRCFDGWDLGQGTRLWVERAGVSGELVAREECLVSSRIGVTSAEELQLRFHLAGNRFVSGSMRLNSEFSDRLGQ